MTAAQDRKMQFKSLARYCLSTVIALIARAIGLAFSTVGLLLVTTSAICYADNIVLIRANHTLSDEQKQIAQIADFYSLKLDSVEVGSKGTAGNAFTRLRQQGTLGVLISYDALPALDRKQVLAALRRPGRASIPILIFGIQGDEDSRELRLWSDGEIRACVQSAKEFRPTVLRVEDVPTLVRTLAGLRLPAVAAPSCTRRVEPGKEAEAVLTAEQGGSSGTVLARTRAERVETLFASHMVPFDRSWGGNPSALPQAFSSVAPFLLFLNHAVGDYGWHLDGHYANLTIDDPWLIEPYGHLDYKALLEEMEKHNFHTTIAFIPWNFDRSEADVVDLLRAHPERYSISIHGNNHAHREFGDYRDSPLQEQVANLKQAVDRMEKFRDLTGISYDRVMIFPHSVAPEATFTALKQLDFLGTANSLNVPAGSAFPADPTFLLRPFTANYGNFLSLFRYSAEGRVSRTEIAIQCFLGNPLLFYGHEKLFDNGIGEFNEFADLVNQIQPDTQWRSLGEIVRHLYLVRRRDDGEFDVRMFSSQMTLGNPTSSDTVFHVELEEDNPAALPSLAVDGSPAPLVRSGTKLTFRLVVPRGQTMNVRLRYHNENVASADLGRFSLHAAALRRISDFRDLYLSRFSLGRYVTGAYYRYGWDSIELHAEMAWRLVVALVGVGLAGAWYFRRKTLNKQVRGGELSR